MRNLFLLTLFCVDTPFMMIVLLLELVLQLLIRKWLENVLIVAPHFIHCRLVAPVEKDALRKAVVADIDR